MNNSEISKPANRLTGMIHVLLVRFVMLIAVSVCALRAAQADVIAEFNFTGNSYSADPSNTPGANGPLNLANSGAAIVGVTSVSNLLFSPSLDPTASLGFAATDYNDALGFSTDANADRDFLTTTQTVYFDVAVAPGHQLNLDSIQFDSLKTRAGNATGSRVTHAVFVNPAGDPAVDGLGGALDFVQFFAHDHFAPGEPGAESTGASFSTGRYAVPKVDLSSFGELKGTNRIAIRLYSSEGMDRDFGIDNLVLHGAVAVPEPGTSGIAFLFAALIAIARPKRRAM